MATKSSTKPGRKVSKSTKSSSAKEKSPRKAAPNAASAATAAPASFRKKEVARNGLRSFAFHRGDKGAEAVLGSIRPNVVRAGAAAGRPSAAAAKAGMKAMDAETVARHYLTNALASEELPTFGTGSREERLQVDCSRSRSVNGHADGEVLPVLPPHAGVWFTRRG